MTGDTDTIRVGGVVTASVRIEQVLSSALAEAEASGCPPRLAAAARYAVMPGGARVRPRLCLAVALSCGDDRPEVSNAAAAAIELLHCASLVHDDLPCFDDAAMRRGRPSVHRVYGERLAVLAGDALIVLAFEVLANGAASAPRRVAPLCLTLANAVGLSGGMAAGQAWECEPKISLETYHRAKTGSLFGAAAAAGAQAAGASAEGWRVFGECLGDAYQFADDIRDVVGAASELGKCAGRDAALGRPSAVASLGLAGAYGRFEQLLHASLAAIPACSGAAELRALVLAEAQRLVPSKHSLRAA